MTLILKNIPPAVKPNQFLEYPYSQKSRPNEAEILHKKELGYKLFGWEKEILEYGRIRKAMYEKEKSCTYCKIELTYEQTTIDHKIPRSRGGTDDPENLTIACEECNGRKRSMTVEEFLACGMGKNLPPSKGELRRLARIEAKLQRAKNNCLKFQTLFFKASPMC